MVVVSTVSAGAVAQTFEFLPEADAYVKLNSTFRVLMQAKYTKEGSDPRQVEIGPSLEFYLKPMLRLKHLNAFDLDDSKTRFLVVTAGYRYVPTKDSPSTNRVSLAVTFHYPLKFEFLLSDRNRADLNWKSGSFTWRYRNKVTLEKTIEVLKHHPVPYVAAEPYYDSQYGKWSTTAVYAGVLFPLGKHVQFDPYYEHQNNTGKTPSQQLNAFGFVVNFYFTVEH
jgi:hypothetical protein